MVVSLSLSNPSKEPVSVNLLIDKLTVVVPQEDAATCKEIWSVLQDCGADVTSFVKKHYPGKLYDTELVMLIPGAQGNVHVGSALFKKSGPFVRFDWNPSKLGAQGHQYLKARVEGMLPYGFDELKAKGWVTRVDVTVDLHGININDIAIVPSASTTASAYWDKKGGFTTLYIGSKKSDAFWRAYDKALEQKLPDGVEITRIERVHKYGLPFSDLVGFSNPFEQLTVCDLSANKVIPAIDPVTWLLFQDACRYSGVAPALAKLPKTWRAQFRMALKGGAVSWWKPGVSWESWPTLVEQLEIAKIPTI